jgi:hypothetical protein
VYLKALGCVAVIGLMVLIETLSSRDTKSGDTISEASVNVSAEELFDLGDDRSSSEYGDRLLKVSGRVHNSERNYMHDNPVVILSSERRDPHQPAVFQQGPRCQMVKGSESEVHALRVGQRVVLTGRGCCISRAATCVID